MATSNPLEPRQCWRTPKSLYTHIRRIYDVSIDACATSASALHLAWFGPDHHDPARRDALAPGVDWGAHITFKSDGSCPGWEWPGRSMLTAYCNPGFSFFPAWLPMMHQQVAAGNVGCVIGMALVAPSTDWWREWVALKASEIVYLSPRVQFVAPEGVEQSSNNRDNCLVIYRNEPRFESTAPRQSVWRWMEARAKKSAQKEARAVPVPEVQPPTEAVAMPERHDASRLVKP